MQLMSVTLDVSQSPIGWLKSKAPYNTACRAMGAQDGAMRKRATHPNVCAAPYAWPVCYDAAVAMRCATAASGSAARKSACVLAGTLTV